MGLVSQVPKSMQTPALAAVAKNALRSTPPRKLADFIKAAGIVIMKRSCKFEMKVTNDGQFYTASDRLPSTTLNGTI